MKLTSFFASAVLVVGTMLLHPTASQECRKDGPVEAVARVHGVAAYVCYREVPAIIPPADKHLYAFGLSWKNGETKRICSFHPGPGERWKTQLRITNKSWMLAL
jgi:hypothetical protein